MLKLKGDMQKKKQALYCNVYNLPHFCLFLENWYTRVVHWDERQREDRGKNYTTRGKRSDSMQHSKRKTKKTALCK